MGNTTKRRTGEAGSSYEDALLRFKRQLDAVYDELDAALRDQPNVCGSKALAYAVAAGLPPRMSYTVSETAVYTGVDYQLLNKEHREGRLAYVMPAGATKGARITVDEVDRWMKANTR